MFLFLIGKPDCEYFLTKYSHCNIAEYSDNKEDAADDIGAGSGEEKTVNESFHQRHNEKSNPAVLASPVLDGSLEGGVVFEGFTYRKQRPS